jgi:hypothetical protein
MAQFIERVIARMGLMLIAEHVAQIKRQNDFLDKIAAAAKEKGVLVLNGECQFTGVTTDQDIFVVGDYNILSNCWLEGGKLFVSPTSKKFAATGCVFKGRTEDAK